MAAGKSTVARLLAERFERGVYVEGDYFRRCIVGGRRELTPDQAPEAVAQLRLRYRLAAAAADTYAREGFTVAVEDIVAGPLLTEYVELIRSRPLHRRRPLAVARRARRTRGGSGSGGLQPLVR
jgi:cytidylate kinase